MKVEVGQSYFDRVLRLFLPFAYLVLTQVHFQIDQQFGFKKRDGKFLT